YFYRCKWLCKQCDQQYYSKSECKCRNSRRYNTALYQSNSILYIKRKCRWYLEQHESIGSNSEFIQRFSNSSKCRNNQYYLYHKYRLRKSGIILPDLNS